MDRKELLQYLHVRYSSGDRKILLKDLTGIVRQQPYDDTWAQALFLMARVVDTNEKQADCMVLILKHRPQDELARQKLEMIRSLQQENPGCSLPIDLDKKPVDKPPAEPFDQL